MSFPHGMKFADDEVHDSFDQDIGMPTLHTAADALQVWSVLQNRTVTVREAAEAFNLDDAQVRELVEAHYWMYLGGPEDDPSKQTIQHEGE